MTIKITEQERKELESIRELFKSDDIEIHRLALNLLKGYERFNKCYTYLYRRRKCLFENKYHETYEFYLNNEGPENEYYGLVQINYYFTDKLFRFRYGELVRDLLLEAIINERDIFCGNGD